MKIKRFFKKVIAWFCATKENKTFFMEGMTAQLKVYHVIVDYNKSIKQLATDSELDYFEDSIKAIEESNIKTGKEKVKLVLIPGYEITQYLAVDHSGGAIYPEEALKFFSEANILPGNTFGAMALIKKGIIEATSLVILGDALKEKKFIIINLQKLKCISMPMRINNNLSFLAILP